MKTSFFVKTLAVFFTAVSVINWSVAADAVKISPPKEAKVIKISVDNNQVRYELLWRAADSLVFTADSKGALIGIYLVEGDHFSISLSRNPVLASGWSKDADKNPKDIDVGVWGKFFSEKVAPVPVIIGAGSQSIALENQIENNPGDGGQWEFIGESRDTQSNRLFNIRRVGTKYIRTLHEEEFALPPPEGRPFFMGVMNGRYCAVEYMTPKGGDAQTMVIAVRAY